MTTLSSHWLPGAAVVPQERGPEFLGQVDGADWSDGLGFYRGFFATFRIRAGKSVWFHWPFQMPVITEGRRLALHSMSLLWETLDGARIDWVTAQHGGMDRIELIQRLASLPSTPVPFEPEPEFRPWCPVTHRELSEFVLATPMPLRFGVQLCVQLSAPESDGTIRFYGAGASFVADH